MKDNNVQNDKVQCKICGEWFKRITYTHLYGHFTTIQEYCQKFNLLPADLLSEKTKKLSNTASLQSWIRRYGQQEGRRKFNEYKQRQAYTNSFQYKKEKYGWTKQQFDEYNKNRAVTLELCIKRHGIQQGTRIYQQYCNRQAYAGNKLQYFIQKYGKVEGQKIYEQIIKQKTITFNNFISSISQQLFEKIAQRLPNQNFNYGNNGGQKCFMIQNKAYYVDFYHPKSNKIIEFFGTYWHADPRIYKQHQLIVYPGKKDILVQQMWRKNQERIENLKKAGVSDIKVVWQIDYKNNPQKTINQCIEFLQKEK